MQPKVQPKETLQMYYRQNHNQKLSITSGYTSGCQVVYLYTSSGCQVVYLYTSAGSTSGYTSGPPPAHFRSTSCPLQAYSCPLPEITRILIETDNHSRGFWATYLIMTLILIRVSVGLRGSVPRSSPNYMDTNLF